MIQAASSDKLKKSSQDDQIYIKIFAAILEQKLLPGTKLSEDTLGEIFGVSRTIIRKVLQRLAYEKVVQIVPNVAEPTPEEAKEILETRRIVEAAIMKAVVRRLDPLDLGALEKNLKAEQSSIENGEHSKWVALSGDFHLMLARIAGNKTLEDFLRELVSRTSLIHVQYQSNKLAQQSCSCEEHGEILSAIRNRDEKRAVKLMVDHLSAIESALNLDGKDNVNDLYRIFGDTAKQA